MAGCRLISVFIFLAVISTGLISCSGNNIKKNPDIANETIEGWINDDTYQIAAGGTSMQSLKLIDQRKESSRLDAIMNARCQIIEKFIGIKIKREALKNNELDGITIPEEMKSIIKAGIVKKTVWDYDENCEIMFEIKYTGLKKKVDERVWN
jgi:hypothetical protein